jgi:hypothetical protein
LREEEVGLALIVDRPTFVGAQSWPVGVYVLGIMFYEKIEVLKMENAVPL